LKEKKKKRRRKKESNREKSPTMASSKTNIIQLVSIRDPSECGAHNEVKAGVKTFIICPNILTRTARHMRAEYAPDFDRHVHSNDVNCIRNVFTLNYTFVRNEVKFMLGGHNIPDSWGNGDAFTNMPILKMMINRSETTMENFLDTFRNLPEGTHTVPGTTLKIGIGTRGVYDLYEEGLIPNETKDKFRTLVGNTESECMIIPYDVENRLIGQFVDITEFYIDDVADAEEAGRFEGSFLEKNNHSFRWLRELKQGVDKVTDLAKKEAASNNDCGGNGDGNGNNGGSAKRKR
jgi:hypothetical protein